MPAVNHRKNNDWRPMVSGDFTLIWGSSRNGVSRMSLDGINFKQSIGSVHPRWVNMWLKCLGIKHITLKETFPELKCLRVVPHRHVLEGYAPKTWNYPTRNYLHGDINQMTRAYGAREVYGTWIFAFLKQPFGERCLVTCLINPIV
ncbi:hypothetical protein SESBI_05405 [Sesbania bispinosa]|nr:hypothetical protein SESBI_05405 [Sesbania bispinosa]